MYKKLFPVVLISMACSLCSNSSVAQIWKKLEKKVNKVVDDKVNQATDKILGNNSDNPTSEVKTQSPDGENPNEKTTQTNKIEKTQPLNSELKEEDLKQFKAKSLQPGYSRLFIARNLAIDVKGGYPRGYQPKWRFVSYKSPLKMKVENWITPNSSVNYNNLDIWLGEYKGKAVLRCGAFISCDCMADIIVNDSISVINETPQTYKVTNFEKILNERRTGEDCIGMNVPHYGGGREGQITLSSDNEGNVVMTFRMETYTAEKRDNSWYNSETKKRESKVFPPKVSYRFLAENITVDNEMSPEKAISIVKAEEEAKQKQKEYLAKMTKQSDSLQKIIAKKYSQECRTCFYSSTGGYVSSSTVDTYWASTGDYAGSHTDYDLNVVKRIKNKCDYPITFVGIQQFYDEVNGYYLKEITKTMEQGYNYSSVQSVMASVFTSLIGVGSEFDLMVQDRYSINYAHVGSVQWLRVVKGK